MVLTVQVLKKRLNSDNMIVKVSSTYLYQISGGFAKVVKAFLSNLIMKISARNTEEEAPMASPSIYTYN